MDTNNTEQNDVILLNNLIKKNTEQSHQISYLLDLINKSNEELNDTRINLSLLKGFSCIFLLLLLGFVFITLECSIINIILLLIMVIFFCYKIIML